MSKSDSGFLTGTWTARLGSFDLLATLVAVVRSDGTVLFANAALEDALGTSRRIIEESQFADCFTEPQVLANALLGTTPCTIATPKPSR